MMSDIMSFSPLWGEWYIKQLIGKGSFGAVYKAEKNEYGNLYYSAIKHISIPPENVTKETLIEDGIATDERTYSIYCDKLRDQIIKEINFCYTLRGNTNIVSYEDHCIIPKKNGVGYDIFIRMELLDGLTKYQSTHPMTERAVAKLGIDLCDALTVLNRNHMIHRDIKPANIFVNSHGVFKLGDFGESKVLSNSSLGMTIRGTYAYMSPEISKGEPANITADIYSLGIVMYRLLNGNRAPFLPVTGQPVDSAASENANVRRFRGEPFPPPAFCRDSALSGIIMRACAFNRQDRWQSPYEMKKALTAVLEGRNPNDSPTVSPQYSGVYNRPAQGQMYSGYQAPPPIMPLMPVQPSVQPSYQPPVQPPKKNKGLLIGVLIGAGAVAAAAVILIFALNSGSKDTNNSSEQSSQSQQSSVYSYEPSGKTSREESSREESHYVITSRPETSRAESSVSSQRSVGDFMSSSEGETFSAMSINVAKSSLDEQSKNAIHEINIYAEGDDVLVFEYVMNLSGLTKDQLNMLVSNLEINRSELEKSAQTSVTAMKVQYNISDFDIIYRYKTKDNVNITDIYISYNR